MLEGTVRRDGNRVRVSAELIDGRNDKTIWADSYDRNLTDIFEIQSEIARIIAAKLAATLSPEEKRRIDAKLTGNVHAYDLYLRAKEILAEVETNGFPFGGSRDSELIEAGDLLDQAVRLDPKFTLAYCLAAKRLRPGFGSPQTKLPLDVPEQKRQLRRHCSCNPSLRRSIWHARALFLASIATLKAL